MDINYSNINNYLSNIRKGNKKRLSNKPKLLYQYKEYNENYFDDIINGNIKVTDPLAFNDIYDCFLFGEKEKYLSTPFKTRDLLIKCYKIACFSEINDSILMWAHYGNMNKGICVEYDIKDYFDEFASIIPVNYEEVPFDFSNAINVRGNLGLHRDILINRLSSKSRVWEYEKEWRLCLQLNDRKKDILIERNGKYFINFIKPKRVILGINFERKIEEELKVKYNNIIFTRVMFSNLEYKFIVENFKE